MGYVDRAKVEELLGEVLKELGVDLSDGYWMDTPERMASWLIEMTERLRDGEEVPLVFTAPVYEAKDFHGPVTVQGIRFRALCAHHFLPFEGTVDIAYAPNDYIIGLSKLARLVEHLSAAPTLQEYLTQDIADHLMGLLKPRWVHVKVTARHMCMVCRGVRQEESSTVTEVRRWK